jgi:hypothetical protein
MKRTAIARGERIEAREVSKLPMPARKATLKSKGPRMTPIRKSARDEECTLPGMQWRHQNDRMGALE